MRLILIVLAVVFFVVSAVLGYQAYREYDDAVFFNKLDGKHADVVTENMKIYLLFTFLSLMCGLFPLLLSFRRKKLKKRHTGDDPSGSE